MASISQKGGTRFLRIGFGVNTMPRIVSADPLYDEFFDPTQLFSTESRWFCYDLATDLVANARSADPENWHADERAIQGVLLLLFTWNFAARITKKLAPANIRCLLAKTKDDLRSLDQYSIITADDQAWDRVARVFPEFMVACGQTGASKALSLLNPRLFVMWDSAIRKRLNRQLIRGIGNGNKTGEYVTFLRGMQRIIKQHGIDKKVKEGANVAKKIDEYNYVRIVMKLSATSWFAASRSACLHLLWPLDPFIALNTGSMVPFANWLSILFTSISTVVSPFFKMKFRSVFAN